MSKLVSKAIRESLIIIIISYLGACTLSSKKNNTHPTEPINDSAKRTMKLRRYNHLVKVRDRLKKLNSAQPSHKLLKELKTLIKFNPNALPIMTLDSNGKSDQILYTTNNFEGKHFYKPITCRDATFSKDMDFSSATFHRPIDISVSFGDFLAVSYAKFNDDVSFNRTSVDGDAYFSEVKFKKNASFQHVKVFGETRFSGSFFSGATDFSGSILSEGASFESAIFSKTVNFAASKFGDGISFQRASFLGHANFDSVYFHKEAIFKQLKLSDSSHLTFEGATLPGTIDFSFDNEIKNGVDFTSASFSDSLHYDKEADVYFKPHYINLYKTDISKFHLDYIHFRLNTDSTIDNKGRKIRIPNDEAEGMYEALLNNFKSRGQMESYKLLDIEYQQYKWKNSNISFMVNLSRYWWNFGYNKEYIFIWTGFFLILFTIISFFCLGYLNKVYKLEKIGQITSFTNQGFSIKDGVVRIWHSFVYTSTIFFRLTLKVEAINYNKFWGTIYIIMMYTIGLICLAYMANFIIQK